ncbi:MAG: hypothetical protein V4654_08250 [Bdellovibrionota bacterium]
MSKMFGVLGFVVNFMIAANVQAGVDSVGNGGDYIREVFFQAKTAAANRILNLQSCSFAKETSSEISQWILDNKGKLANDILTSQHIWTSDHNPTKTCAYTLNEAGAPITLSFSSCERISSIEAAIWTLTHEAAHHFGYAEEPKADEIARAVMNASLVKECAKEKFDLYSPQSCQGSAMSLHQAMSYMPGSETGSPQYSVKKAGRHRICNNVNGCGPWIDFDMQRVRLHIDGKSAALKDIDAHFRLRSIPNKKNVIYELSLLGDSNVTFSGNEWIVPLKLDSASIDNVDKVVTNSPLLIGIHPLSTNSFLDLKGTFTDQCWRIASSTRERIPSRDVDPYDHIIEVDFVMLALYR